MGTLSTLSCKFDGYTQSAAIGDVIPLQFERTDAFTLSAWVKTTDGDGVIVGKQLSVSPYAGFVLAMSATKIHVELNNLVFSNAIVIDSNETGNNDGLWNHIVMTYDGSSTGSGVKLYKNGSEMPVSITLDALTASILSTASFQISSRPTDWYLASTIDEVSVYNIVISANDVTNLYNFHDPPDLLVTGPTVNLVGYWKMGEGATFPTIPDVSGNVNNATLTNMVVADIVLDAPSGVIGTYLTSSAAKNLTYGSPADSMGQVKSVSIAADLKQINPGAGGASFIYKMRGIDSLAGFVSWIATIPDFAGTQISNSVPSLSGTLVSGSVIQISRILI